MKLRSAVLLAIFSLLIVDCSKDNGCGNDRFAAMKEARQCGNMQHEICKLELATVSEGLLSLDSVFREEFVAWDSLQVAVEDYASHLVVLNYYGGSICGRLITMIQQELCLERLADLRRIGSLYDVHSEWPDAQELKTACDSFLLSVDSLSDAQPLELPNEFEDSSYNRPEDNKGYHERYQMMRAAQKNVKESFDVWVAARKKLANTHVEGWYEKEQELHLDQYTASLAKEILDVLRIGTSQ